MNTKKRILSVLVLVLLLSVLSACGSGIPDGFFAVFHGGVGEVCYMTYVYDNGDGSFDYVNVKSVTKSYGSAEWRDTVSAKKTADSVQELFDVAEKQGAYQYVTVGDEPDLYTVEEFRRMYFG